jgi:hypothetical protein
LSATSSIVRIPIMSVLPKNSCGAGLKPRAG